jgi:hypothetical protein
MSRREGIEMRGSDEIDRLPEGLNAGIQSINLRGELMLYVIHV